jgi:hypothetical protein
MEVTPTYKVKNGENTTIIVEGEDQYSLCIMKLMHELDVEQQRAVQEANIKRFLKNGSFPENVDWRWKSSISAAGMTRRQRRIINISFLQARDTMPRYDKSFVKKLKCKKWLPVEDEYLEYITKQWALQEAREKRFRDMQWRIRQLDIEIEHQYPQRQHAHV